MNSFKKLVALLTVAATLCTSAGVLSAEGCAYEGTQCATRISPTIALGTVAVVAAVVIIVTNNSHNKHKSGSGSSSDSGSQSHSHSHSHSHS